MDRFGYVRRKFVGPKELIERLISAANIGSITEAKHAVATGADVNAFDPLTGLSALHFAIGTDNLSMARYLIEEAGATVGPTSPEDGRL